MWLPKTALGASSSRTYRKRDFQGSSIQRIGKTIGMLRDCTRVFAASSSPTRIGLERAFRLLLPQHNNTMCSFLRSCSLGPITRTCSEIEIVFSLDLDLDDVKSRFIQARTEAQHIAAGNVACQYRQLTF
jgi:hypothetical protein